MKLTQWHKGTEKPVRSGWYQVKSINKYWSEFSEGLYGKPIGGDAWRYWDGKCWRWVKDKKSGLKLSAVGSSDKWRGITKP